MNTEKNHVGAGLRWAEAIAKEQIAEQKLKVAREALEDIINPFEAMRRAVPEGYRFEGGMAIHMANDPEWYKRRAREAIDALAAPAAPPVAEIPAQTGMAESVPGSIDTQEPM